MLLAICKGVKMHIFYGEACSMGVGIGKAAIIKKDILSYHNNRFTDSDFEKKRYKQAVERLIQNLEKVIAESKGELGEIQGDVFRSHIMMAEDQDVSDEVYRLIQEGKTAEEAVDMAYHAFIILFEQEADEWFRQRVYDVRDVRDCLLRILLNKRKDDYKTLPLNTILVTDELSPSMTVHLNPDYIEAIITKDGGKHSHAAMIVRLMQIPAVFGLDKESDLIRNHDTLIVDGSHGIVLCSSDEKEFVYKT